MSNPKPLRRTTSNMPVPSYSAHDKEVKTAMLQGKPITVTHLTPVLTPEQRRKRKREIETELYDVFSQSQEKRRKAR